VGATATEVLREKLCSMGQREADGACLTPVHVLAP